jgi:hypothetical protein
MDSNQAMNVAIGIAEYGSYLGLLKVVHNITGGDLSALESVCVALPLGVLGAFAVADGLSRIVLGGPEYTPHEEVLDEVSSEPYTSTPHQSTTG